MTSDIQSNPRICGYVLVLSLIILGTFNGAMCESTAEVESMDAFLSDGPMYESAVEVQVENVFNDEPMCASAADDQVENVSAEDTTELEKEVQAVPLSLLLSFLKDLLCLLGVLWAWEPWTLLFKPFQRRGKADDATSSPHSTAGHRAQSAAAGAGDTNTAQQVHESLGKEDEGSKKRAGREYWMDHLKVLLCCLVVYNHDLAFYGGNPLGLTGVPIGYYPENPMNHVYEVVNQFLDGFYMDLFCFLAAYNLHASVQRRGCKIYLKDRFRRLGTWVLAERFFNVGMRWVNMRSLNVLPADKIDFGLHMTFMILTEGAMWFNTRLLMMTTVYLALGQPFRNSSVALPQLWFLAAISVASVAILLVLCDYVTLSLIVWKLPSTVAYFVGGLLAKNGKWMDTLVLKLEKGAIWLWSGILVAATAVAYRIFGHFSTVHSLQRVPDTQEELILWIAMRGLQGIACTFVGIYFCRKYMNTPMRYSRYLGNLTYAVYVLHGKVLWVFHLLFIKFANAVLEEKLEHFCMLTPMGPLHQDESMFCSNVVSPTVPKHGVGLFYIGHACTFLLTLLIVWPVAYRCLRIPVLNKML